MSPGQRPHKPAEIGPRVFQRGRWFAVDLRPWDMGRPTMRNPKHPAWPDQGERTASREVAERWRLAYWERAETEHTRAMLGRAGPAQKIQDAVRAYLSHRAATREPATYSADRTALNHLLDHMGENTPTSRVTTPELQNMVAGFLRRGYKASTLETYLQSIRVFFGWLGTHDPTEGVELPNPGRDDVEPWTDREIQALRQTATQIGPAARVGLEAGLSMGLRQGEIFGLRWTDVDAETKTVRVRRQIPKDAYTPKGLKGKRARTAVVLPGWWEFHQPGIGYVLGEDGKPLGPHHQRTMIDAILERAGLKSIGVGWHSLRHTYARLFLEAGGWMDELQRSMGHASIQTTERVYGHLRPDRAAERASVRIYG